MNDTIKTENQTVPAASDTNTASAVQKQAQPVNQNGQRRRGRPPKNQNENANQNPPAGGVAGTAAQQNSSRPAQYPNRQNQNQNRNPQQKSGAANGAANSNVQSVQNSQNNMNQPNAKAAQPNVATQAVDAAAAAANGQRKNFRPYYRQVQRKNPITESHAPQLRLYPLGGLGEVGKNITVYECEGDMFLMDCGLVFPDSDMYGIDLVIPDFSFVLQSKDKIKGIVITHGHEDHIGSLPYLLKQLNLPIYATRLTIGLIQNKLEEHGLRAATKCIEIAPRKKFKLGCFTIEPIHVNHSIPDAVAFAVDCPAGVVLHTGDFKIDYTPISGGPTDLATIAEYGKHGVLALLSDSTNAERPGFTATEHKVAAGIEALFTRADKERIIIATFASNLYRIQQIIDLAIKANRKVAVSGRSMVNNTEMARELGYLHIPENVLIEVDQLNKYPPEKVVLITTGSQGETLSALSRMSSGTHRSVHVGKGDFIIISANPIPGNEKMVTKVINGLLLLGAEVIYESMYDVHVSGHACQEEQKLVLTLSAPQFFLPVHGEYKQLKRHAMTGASLGIPESNIYIGNNGDCIILSKDGMKLGEPVSAGAVMVDGLGVGDVGNIVMRDRRHLSEDGLVIVVATVDGSTGQLLAGPDIVSRGFVYVRENEQLIDDARDQVREMLGRLQGSDMRDWNSVKTRIRETVSAYLYRKTKRSPMILPILMDV